MGTEGEEVCKGPSGRCGVPVQQEEEVGQDASIALTLRYRFLERHQSSSREHLA